MQSVEQGERTSIRAWLPPSGGADRTAAHRTWGGGPSPALDPRRCSATGVPLAHGGAAPLAPAARLEIWLLLGVLAWIPFLVLGYALLF